MERNKRDLGYYGERLSKIGEYNVEEINNPSTKDDKKINILLVTYKPYYSIYTVKMMYTDKS